MNIFMFTENKLSFIRKNLTTLNVTKLTDNWQPIIVNFEDIPETKMANGKHET